MIDALTLKNLKIDQNKLQTLGFEKRDRAFVFSKKIIDGEFCLSVQIENDLITSCVTEVSNGERYVLYDVKGHEGAFVGLMRKEYFEIVNQVKENCCTKNGFKTKSANNVIDYVWQTYRDKPEFLWEKTPDSAIIRNKLNAKWYVVFLCVDNSKLGIKEKGKSEIVNLHLQPELIKNLLDNANFFPAFHMNKKHWITVRLNDNLNDAEIFNLIDISYNLSTKKKTSN